MKITKQQIKKLIKEELYSHEYEQDIQHLVQNGINQQTAEKIADLDEVFVNMADKYDLILNQLAIELSKSPKLKSKKLARNILEANRELQNTVIKIQTLIWGNQ